MLTGRPLFPGRDGLGHAGRHPDPRPRPRRPPSGFPPGPRAYSGLLAQGPPGAYRRSLHRTLPARSAACPTASGGSSAVAVLAQLNTRGRRRARLRWDCSLRGLETQTVACRGADAIRVHIAAGTTADADATGRHDLTRTVHAWWTPPTPDCISGPCRGSSRGRYPGAEPAGSEPVFSPDGESLLFWRWAVKGIAVTGGPSVLVCQLDYPPAGITWSNKGILFSDSQRGIMRVSPDGGKPEQLVGNTAEDLVYGPQLLPGGRAVLFGIVKHSGRGHRTMGRAQDRRAIARDGRSQDAGRDGTQARYVQTGHPRVHVEWDAVRGAVRSRQAGDDIASRSCRRGRPPWGRAGWSGWSGPFRIFRYRFTHLHSRPIRRSSKAIWFLFDRKGGTEALKLPPSQVQTFRAYLPMAS